MSFCIFEASVKKYIFYLIWEYRRSHRYQNSLNIPSIPFKYFELIPEYICGNDKYGHPIVYSRHDIFIENQSEFNGLPIENYISYRDFLTRRIMTTLEKITEQKGVIIFLN